MINQIAQKKTNLKFNIEFLGFQKNSFIKMLYELYRPYFFEAKLETAC